MACAPRIDLHSLGACCLNAFRINTRLDVTLNYTNAKLTTESLKRLFQQGGLTSARRTHHVDCANTARRHRLLYLLGNGVISCQDILSDAHFGHGCLSSTGLRSPFQVSAVRCQKLPHQTTLRTMGTGQYSSRSQTLFHSDDIVRDVAQHQTTIALLLELDHS